MFGLGMIETVKLTSGSLGIVSSMIGMMMSTVDWPGKKVTVVVTGVNSFPAIYKTFVKSTHYNYKVV